MMARIRSIHPGLFTDERFVEVSDAAQIFYVGLLTEADDQGIFEWKPLTLKMKIRPASLLPVDPLLAELSSASMIKLAEIDGRKYGAIRNFRRFQKPKSPNATHPITDELRNYVALTRSISEIDADDPDEIPPDGEIFPQMEDGGWRMEDGKPSAKVKRDAKRKRYFTEDEQLDPDFYGIASELGLEPQPEWEKFRDYHVKEGKGTLSAKASFRTWCKNAVEYTRRANLRIVR